MNERALKYLYDIKFAVDEINSFFVGRQRIYGEYVKDIMLKRAI